MAASALSENEGKLYTCTLILPWTFLPAAIDPRLLFLALMVTHHLPLLEENFSWYLFPLSRETL